MAITDIKAKQAKPEEKPYRISDEKGMYLEVSPKGGKYWRLKYRFGGKEKRLALGVYPDVSLKDARKKRETARKHIENGIDPSAIRRTTKHHQQEAAANSFSAIANEWYAKQLPTWAPATAKKRRALLDNDLIPYLGGRPISELETIDLLGCLQRIEQRGAIDTAHNGRQVLNQICRYAKQTQRCKQNPATDLTGGITPKITNHRPAITDPAGFGKLLIDIDNYRGTHIVRVLVALAPLLFQRPGELLAMEWAEIDLEAAAWEIPAAKMKMSIAHTVPLSHQAVALLLDIKPLTGNGQYVFPSQRRGGKHASENTINKALRNMGYDTKTQHCAHGFRASARTMLDERMGFKLEWIEHQLAHAVKDALGRAYNRTKHLDQRKDMMQKWADYLDSLKEQAISGNVITGNFKQAN